MRKKIGTYKSGARIMNEKCSSKSMKKDIHHKHFLGDDDDYKM